MEPATVNVCIGKERASATIERVGQGDRSPPHVTVWRLADRVLSLLTFSLTSRSSFCNVTPAMPSSLPKFGILPGLNLDLITFVRFGFFAASFLVTDGQDRCLACRFLVAESFTFRSS
jgi:hypothetical protein